MSIVEKFMSMEYGPAPEDPREAVVWLERHERRLGHFIDGALAGSCRGEIFRYGGSFHWGHAGERRAGFRCGCGCGRESRARGFARVAGAVGACASAVPLRAGPAGAEAFAAAGGAGDDGQWEADSREPRYRYPVGRAPFLSSCGMGAVVGAGISGLHGLRRGRSNHSLEFSAPHAGVEDCTCFGDGKYGGVEARRIHTAYGFGICGDLPGSRAACRCGEYRYRRWFHRRGTGRSIPM